MLQNDAFFVPKESQHNHPCWWFCSKLLWLWWWGMAPFLARSLHFRLVGVNTGFFPSNDSCKEAITCSFKAPKKFFTSINTSLSLNSGVSCRGTHLADTLWNWSTSCTMWCDEPWLIFKHAAISFSVTRQFSFTTASTAAMFCGVTTRCAWPGQGASSTKSHHLRTSYSIRTFAAVTNMHHRTVPSFFDEFQ